MKSYHTKNTMILCSTATHQNFLQIVSQSASTLETITAHVRLNRFSKRRKEGREKWQREPTLCIYTRTKKLLNSVFLLGQVERDTIITRYCSLREKLCWKDLDVARCSERNHCFVEHNDTLWETLVEKFVQDRLSLKLFVRMRIFVGMMNVSFYLSDYKWIVPLVSLVTYSILFYLSIWQLIRDG